LRSAFVRLGAPFVRLGDYIPAVRSRRQLASENAELRARNESLQLQLLASSEAGLENRRLREMLRLKEQTSQRAIAARVIGRDASNWWKSIQIDRGTQDGVRENLPVVNAHGIVGKTVAVTKGEARVLLLVDPNCKVSALLQDSREHGVVAGVETAFAGQPRCRMTYVNRAAEVRVGEPVISSGLGGVFPKGILIGTVLAAALNSQTGMYQDIEVKPAVDFHRLEEVMVIVE
jgi:rod shape-determining protein MreC